MVYFRKTSHLTGASIQRCCGRAWPLRWTYVVLACAHLDHDRDNNDPANLAALCQRCHMIHDAAEHRSQRWRNAILSGAAEAALFRGWPHHLDLQCSAAAAVCGDLLGLKHITCIVLPLGSLTPNRFIELKGNILKTESVHSASFPPAFDSYRRDADPLGKPLAIPHRLAATVGRDPV